jgi:protein-L-isoaspartate(D-aspartate) O-methyltransferase
MIESQVRTSKVTDQAVISALAAVPRELFVAAPQRKLAYIDRAVPIGAGRRMTEPMVLARLLQAAHLRSAEQEGDSGADNALIVGAGTGYSTAVLSRLVKQVVALESAAALAQAARGILAGLELKNTKVVDGELAGGWASEGPYDFILVDGAAEQMPEALTGQLAEFGRLAVVMTDDGVGRGTLFQRADGVITRRAVFDADADLLPGFTRPKRFVF